MSEKSSQLTVPHSASDDPQRSAFVSEYWERLKRGEKRERAWYSTHVRTLPTVDIRVESHPDVR